MSVLGDVCLGLNIKQRMTTTEHLWRELCTNDKGEIYRREPAEIRRRPRGDKLAVVVETNLSTVVID